MSLQTFLAEAQARLRAEAAAREAAREAALRAEREEFVNHVGAALGDLWPELQPYAGVRRGQNWFDLLVLHPDLANFSIRRNGGGCMASDARDEHGCQFDSGNRDALGPFLLAMRKRRLQEQQAQEKALAAEKERQEREAAEEAAEATYARDHAEYERGRQAVIGENRRMLDILQAAHNQPFFTWTLTYALVGGDKGNDERFLETSTVDVLTDVPDDAECWSVVGCGGTVRGVRYQHVVSVEGPHEHRPTDGRHTSNTWVPQANAALHLTPGTAPDVAQRILARVEWLRLPEPPAPPAHLSMASAFDKET